MQRVKLPGLEAVRCYAAILIVLFHLVHLSKIEVPASLSFIGTHFGFGVPLFYMVSAFGLFLGYQHTLRSANQWKDYYLRRFLRIAPLFYFMMLFYIPYLWLLYDGYFVPLNKFISSLLFIFNLIPGDVDGFVWASWSIGVEMLFYLFLPVAIFAIRNIKSACLFLLISLYTKYHWVQSFESAVDSVTLSNFKTYFILAHIHYFALGILAYFVWASAWEGRSRKEVGIMFAVLGLTGFILAIACSSPVSVFLSSVIGENLASYVYQVILAVCLALSVIGLSLFPVKLLVNPWVCSLGKTSFSLYLWHPVVIVSLVKSGAFLFLYDCFVDVRVGWYLSVLLTFTVLIPISYFSYRLIEVPGMRLIRYFNAEAMSVKRTV